jgi:hypothetical protein
MHEQYVQYKQITKRNECKQQTHKPNTKTQ